MTAADRRDWSSPERAQQVLDYLRERADPETDEVTVTVRVIGEHLGIGRNTAHTAISRLLAGGFVEVARLGTGRAYPTRYLVKTDL